MPHKPAGTKFSFSSWLSRSKVVCFELLKENPIIFNQNSSIMGSSGVLEAQLACFLEDQVGTFRCEGQNTQIKSWRNDPEPDHHLDPGHNLEPGHYLEPGHNLKTDHSVEPEHSLEPEHDLEPDHELEPDHDLQTDHSLEPDHDLVHDITWSMTTTWRHEVTLLGHEMNIICGLLHQFWGANNAKASLVLCWILGTNQCKAFGMNLGRVLETWVAQILDEMFVQKWRPLYCKVQCTFKYILWRIWMWGRGSSKAREKAQEENVLELWFCHVCIRKGKGNVIT